MRRRFPHGWIALPLCVGIIAGCGLARTKSPYPDDPLLASRKPVEGKQQAAPSTMLARAEPVAPPFPESLLAAKPELRRPATSTSESPTRVPASLAGGKRPLLRATPAVRRRVSGAYGHAPDLSWLQGVLTKSPTGTLQLRYIAQSPEHPGGKFVNLEEDPRLAAFRPGDVVLVEGESIAASGTTWYRAHSVWLVKREE
jgi:hypothetical protein